MVEPLLHFLTAWVIALIEGLRGGCDQHIRRVFLDPTCRSDKHIRRMIRELKQGERKIWREIREAALRELGIPFTRLPLEYYARPKSRTPQALRARLQAYENMLRDPEGCVRRLVAKLRADMKLSMLDRMRGPTLDCIQPVIAPLVTQLRMPRLIQRAAPLIHPP